jgi:hypothetical protein
MWLDVTRRYETRYLVYGTGGTRCSFLSMTVTRAVFSRSVPKRALRLEEPARRNQFIDHAI